MPNKITNLCYFADNKGIRWSSDTGLVERAFDNPVKVVPLTSGSGLLVVEPASAAAPDTAVILNADGTLRARIKNPEAHNGAICFGDAYYVQDELTLIICFSSEQMGCVIDDQGNVTRTYETR